MCGKFNTTPSICDFGWQSNGNTTPEKEKPSPSGLANHAPSSGERRRLPRTHNPVVLIAQGCNLASIVFLILVLLGSTHNTHALTEIYFLKIDLSQVIPRGSPNAVLVNSIAQTLGLHGFYQVGAWNYCEGYQSEGVTFCGTPRALYSFDPIEILVSQLFQGATSQFPYPILSLIMPH
jgi:hypothetical protein